MLGSLGHFCPHLKMMYQFDSLAPCLEVLWAKHKEGHTQRVMRAWNRRPICFFGVFRFWLAHSIGIFKVLDKSIVADNKGNHTVPPQPFEFISKVRDLVGIERRSIVPACRPSLSNICDPLQISESWYRCGFATFSRHGPLNSFSSELKSCIYIKH